MHSDRSESAPFDLPVEAIRRGYYTDAYFNHSKELLEAEARDPVVVMQVFQKNEAVLAGMEETIEILRRCAGRYGPEGAWESAWSALVVSALEDGARISPQESVLHIEGPYASFAHLETVYLGVLSRRTLVATNAARCVEAAAGKPVLYFGARHDDLRVQAGDGWAARIGGVGEVASDAGAAWIEGEGVGTIPHALIAAYGGDTVAAAEAFADRFAGRMNVTVLVDFDNDSIATALAVADELGDRLWGVRLDTAGSVVDRALWGTMGDFDPTGVNVELARRVREALDEEGHDHVKIVASGGFDADEVAEFESAGAPVDAYGIGSAILAGSNDFTADIVCVEGEPVAKAGRELRPNERLRSVA